MTRNSLLVKLSEAIARQEGYDLRFPGLIPVMCHNPGNLRDVKRGDSWAFWPELPHHSLGFPFFPTHSAGWTALEHDLNLKINRGLTLEQLIRAWAPPSENDTHTYLKNVQAWTGILPSLRLLDLLNGSDVAAAHTT